VNVALAPILAALYFMGRSSGWASAMPDTYHLVRAILAIDVGLLVFNILPVYPLDGGQILRSLLWFVLGRARSLRESDESNDANDADNRCDHHLIPGLWTASLSDYDY
jgi:hypothetical protein